MLEKDKIIIKHLTANDINAIVNAFTQSNWTEKPASTFQQYLDEQKQDLRIVWAAYVNNHFAGYITLKWHSSYPYFKTNNIPEINDLNVLPASRNKGIGTLLLKTAEARAFEKSDIVGLGVGLYVDYGNAQKLYAKRGYIPDGSGITYEYKPVKPGSQVKVDDELLIWLVKKK